MFSGSQIEHNNLQNGETSALAEDKHKGRFMGTKPKQLLIQRTINLNMSSTV